MWRLTAVPWAAALTLLAAGCSSDNQACRSCPPVEGSWALTYDPPNPSCAGAPEPPATLAVTRVGSIVRSQLGGTELTGTAYDTFDFTLRGDLAPADGGTGADHVELRARYLPGSGDGGVDRLRGTWTFVPRGPPCTESRELQGTRAP